MNSPVAQSYARVLRSKSSEIILHWIALPVTHSNTQTHTYPFRFPIWREKYLPTLHGYYKTCKEIIYAKCSECKLFQKQHFILPLLTSFSFAIVIYDARRLFGSHTNIRFFSKRSLACCLLCYFALLHSLLMSACFISLPPFSFSTGHSNCRAWSRQKFSSQIFITTFPPLQHYI